MNNILNIDFNALAAEIHENAKAKGFWDKAYNHDEKIMLIVSELGEALEAHRKGKFADIPAYKDAMHELPYLSENERREKAFVTHMKDTFEDELADTVIRILDLIAYLKGTIRPVDKLKVDKNEDDYNVGSKLLTVTKSIVTYHFFDARARYSIALLFQIAEYHDTDLLYHIKEKMWYNSTRQRMHGKSY